MKWAPGLLGLALAGIASTALVRPSAAEDAALVSAAKAGKWATVAELVHAAPNADDVNRPGPDGTTAIHWAVHARNTEMVRALAHAGANVGAVNRYGETPLSLAARDGDAALLDVLLAAGADAAAAERALPEGQTLAMLVARTGNVDALDALSSHGAIDVNAREKRTETTALMWAAMDNRADATRYLLKLGADPNLRSRITDYPHLGNGVLLTAPEAGVSFVGQTPLQRGGWTALMYAARSGAVETAKALTGAEVDLNALDPLGESALTLAIINGHWPLVDHLLDAGADPNVADLAGSTPLYAAVDFHTLPATYGRPAPKASVVAGSVPVVTRLLAAGAHVDAALTGATLRRQYTAGDGKLKVGSTPLMRAAAAGDVEMMRILLDAGANVKAAQKNGKTALMVAAAAAKGEAGSPDYVAVEQAIAAVDLCIERGDDIHATDADGRTVVHLAAAAATLGTPQMIRLLVERGAAVNAEDKQGKTPLVLARESKTPDEATIATLRQLTTAD